MWATAAAVAHICRRLDGLPLALELAAAWSKLLPPPALLARLERRLPLLTGGPHDLPARQQTLRRTLDWSHALLDATEQVLFRRLAMFVGGCTLAAAEAVCGDHAGNDEPRPGEGSPAAGRADPAPGAAEGSAVVLDGLASLLDKSLLRQDEWEGGEPRFAMLETIREYGREKLAARGEEGAIRARHARYYASLIGEFFWPSVWYGPRVEFFPVAEAERENLRAALRWVAESGDPDAGLLLAVRLSRLWHTRGPASEGREWLARFLALSRAAARSSLHAAGHLCASYLAEAGDEAAAQALLEEGLAIARQAGDAVGIARILEGLERSALRTRDVQRARAFYEECLTRARETGDRGARGQALIGLGDVARLQGDDATAAALYEDSRRLDVHTNWALRGLGYVALHAGDSERARELITQSLEVCRWMQSTLGSTECLAAFAALDAVRGQGARAVRLFAAQAEVLRRIGGEATPADRADSERFLAAARAALPEDAFEAAWAEGRAMTLEEAIADALQAWTITTGAEEEKGELSALS
jgi:non-specific serine/threonine protein kinase